ncbi:CD2-associated protein [Caerostris extrusa]|uniref:CD2-associated protein n=1 Tax=Caerostris extrusa TaxID=172846 RepID=A0AAV4TJP4_CAEEX|nr:CD2-associated protein [Caerostris extrusa]
MANIENKILKDLKKRMVKALFSYSPVNSDELTLKINDILEVVEETEEGWWSNNLLIQNKPDSKQGIINSTNTEVTDGSSSSKPSADSLPEKKIREQAKVIFPYESQNEDELSLKEGDIITVLSKEIEDKGWWRGELNNRIGVFPDNFCETHKSRRTLKIPPAKPPPPPEIHKKEPDRPLPPCPSKKPQPPAQPVKKPSRSSLGPKLLASPAVTSSKSISSETIPSVPVSFPSSLEKTEEAIKTENIKKKDKDNESSKVSEEMEFDLIEPCGKKLIHLTANRAKAPNRRPPSFIFLKENKSAISASNMEIKNLRFLSDKAIATYIKK